MLPRIPPGTLPNTSAGIFGFDVPVIGTVLALPFSFPLMSNGMVAQATEFLFQRSIEIFGS